jgi:serine/threonine protein kinase
LLKDYIVECSPSNHLGEGGVGEVWIGRHNTNSSEKVAVKEVKCKPGYDRRSEEELKASKTLKHRNVVEFIDCERVENNVYFVMELCDRNFNALFKQYRRKIRAEQCIRYMEGIADGVKYMHNEAEKTVCHRDLKPLNILVKEDIPKIADFGLACFIRETSDSPSDKTIGVGTPYWQAPEIHRPVYSFPVDVFSVGLIFLAMLCHEVGESLIPHTGECFCSDCCYSCSCFQIHMIVYGTAIVL